MEKIKYAGWENCYRLDNGRIELVITGDVGPRVIRFGFIDRTYPYRLGISKQAESALHCLRRR